MKFDHSGAFYPCRELPDITTDGSRVYDTPKGYFKSVTTIIGEQADKSHLQPWKDRVGEEEAKAVLRQAGRRGTAIHSLAEKYLLEDPLWHKGAMPVNVWTFKKIARQLDAHITKIYGIEYPLYSDLFRTAGRTDLPAQWDGMDAIVDFKTAKKFYGPDQVHDYFIQATTYALMFEELTGLKMPWLVILMAVDEEDEARVFIERCRDWYPEVKRVFIDRP